MKQIINCKRLFFLLCVLLTLLVVTQVEPPVIWGQTTAAEPVNLSRSGGAEAPVTVVDTAGVVHVVWEDMALGMMYTHEEGDGWRDPVPVTVPFAEEEPPLLRADAQGRIHAFWRNEDNELFYSRVTIANFADADVWTVPQQLAASALALDVTVAENGRLHLAYVRRFETADAPAGIYYRQSDTAEVDGGQNNWSAAQPLYLSAYYRSITAGDAHVQIALSDLGRVLVAWDNRALDQVYLSRSDNGGQDWQQTPLRVDQREAADVPDAAGPANIRVATQGPDVHLIWQAGHDGLDCGVYHSRSGDGGETWESRQQLWDQCFQLLQFLGSHDDLLILLLLDEDNAYTIAWDGQRWSEPERWPALNQFVTRDTFQAIRLGCRQAMMQSGRLMIAGCDQRRNSDIWFLERTLGTVADWFPPPSDWRDPQQIMVQERVADAPFALKLFSDAQERTHLFWHWPRGSEIYYSFWDGRRWLLQPIQVLNSPGGGNLDLTVFMATADRFAAVWGDMLSGQLYFSQVEMDQAALAADWFDIVALPVTQAVTGMPAAVRLPDGRLLVAYAAPINEGRGIYLITSADRGTTWSEPVQVFDGAAAGWSVVGSPYLTQTDSGELHLMWVQDTLARTQTASRLVYAYSADEGESWSAPQTVAETTVSTPLIVGVGESTVHRTWLTHSDGRASLWHQYSEDNGRSWSQAARVSGTVSNGLYTMVTDPDNGVHLLRVVDLALEHWVWNGSQWLGEEGVTLQPERGRSPTIVGLTATASAQQGLIVSYAQTVRLQGDQQTQWRTGIYVISRELSDIAFDETTAVPTMAVAEVTPATPDVDVIATPIPESDEDLLPDVTLSPTSTPTAAPIDDAVSDDNELEADDGPPVRTNTISGLAVGILAAVFVVAIIFVIGLRVVRRR